MKMRSLPGVVALVTLGVLGGCVPAPTSAPTLVQPTQAPLPTSPAPTPALDIRAIMKDCTDRGNVFSTKPDGSWSCVPPAPVQGPTPKPVFSAANCPGQDVHGGLLNIGQSTLSGHCIYDPTPVPVKIVRTYFRLVNRHTQMCLTAQRGTWAIVQEPCGSDRPEQEWKWDGKRIDLESRSGICVGYNLGFGEDNNALRQVDCSGRRPWTIYLVQWPGDPPPLRVAAHPHQIVPSLTPALDSAPYYYIAMTDGDCVDVEAWSHQGGQRIIHTPCQCPLQRDYDNQLWTPY